MFVSGSHRDTGIVSYSTENWLIHFPNTRSTALKVGFLILSWMMYTHSLIHIYQTFPIHRELLTRNISTVSTHKKHTIEWEKQTRNMKTWKGIVWWLPKCSHSQEHGDLRSMKENALDHTEVAEGTEGQIKEDSPTEADLWANPENLSKSAPGQKRLRGCGQVVVPGSGNIWGKSLKMSKSLFYSFLCLSVNDSSP